MTFNIGVIIGPILGGVLSDPAGSYPDLFGNVPFFLSFPYAAPNLLSAFILFVALVLVWLCLEEVRVTFPYPGRPQKVFAELANIATPFRLMMSEGSIATAASR